MTHDLCTLLIDGFQKIIELVLAFSSEVLRFGSKNKYFETLFLAKFKKITNSLKILKNIGLDFILFFENIKD
jgi:hypothetical protein